MSLPSSLAPSRCLLTDPPSSDVDQVKADLLSPRHLQLFKETKAAEDLPGLGRHYCVECAKWFETESSLVLHGKGKPHKRRSVTFPPPFIFCGWRTRF